jgi:predicted alpha-1,2-mannosidase
VAPYYAADTRIQGFRGSHVLSGSCTQDYGSFTVMPISGTLKLFAANRASAYSHSEEHADPAEYSVDLSDYAIHADITGTNRSGLMRFRYNRQQPAWLVLQTNSRASVRSAKVHIDTSGNEVWGENPIYRLYAGSGKAAGYSGYFVMQFDHPIKKGGGWDTGTGRRAPGSQQGVYLGFDLHAGESLEVRIGISFTSVEDARLNLRSEVPTWDYLKVRTLADSAWEQMLGSVQIAGSAPERRIFYTALYHSLLLPRVASDVSGHYPSFGGGKTVETANGFTYYDDYSLWDTFRATHPLFTIIDPVREGEMVASLVVKGTEGGYLPIHPAWNSYTSEMTGDHADAVIVDAYRKGIRNFNVDEAYRLMLHNATVTPPLQEYEVLGGNGPFIAKLDKLFADGYYDQSNEPSHHIAYLYDYAGAPWKTQQHVRAILDSNYQDRVDGLSGNDDCGQMSSWYVLSALGFYPVTPRHSGVLPGSSPL